MTRSTATGDLNTEGTHKNMSCPVRRCHLSRSVVQNESCGGLHSFDLFKLWLPEAPHADEYPEYLGCFADDQHDRVMTNMIAAESMTPALCREHCSDKDASFYGTQVGLRGGGRRSLVCLRKDCVVVFRDQLMNRWKGAKLKTGLGAPTVFCSCALT